MACVVQSGSVLGIDGVPVTVEVDLLNRLPCMVIVGLPDGAVRESADRVRSAMSAIGFTFPKKRVVVNLAPADLPKCGTAFDLPIAMGLFLAVDPDLGARCDGTVFVGELSLEGRLRPVRGALALALMAGRTGARRIVLPAASGPEAAVLTDIEVLGADTLGDVLRWAKGEIELPRAVPGHTPPPPDLVDFSEVQGQARARRAIEVAAAGGHNLLLVGAPGCGKSMLAGRMPTILPALTFEEALDITRIQSAAGLVQPGDGLVTRRPFRAPHHSTSAAGMIGGASLLPGEVSLAHGGVLFLDEVPEFGRHVLESLRGPLEERQVTLTRVAGTARFPAGFSLVAAANPCPCGFSGHPVRPCVCAPASVERYRSRLSGPLLDRIDLQVWVQPVLPDDLVRGRPGESSARIRERVEAARDAQRRRFRDAAGVRCNADLRGGAIRPAAAPTPEAERLLHDVMEAHALSARAWSRILKVARTVADLDGVARVLPEHVLEAASYRVDTGSETDGPERAESVAGNVEGAFA